MSTNNLSSKLEKMSNELKELNRKLKVQNVALTALDTKVNAELVVATTLKQDVENMKMSSVSTLSDPSSGAQSNPAISVLSSPPATNQGSVLLNAPPATNLPLGTQFQQVGPNPMHPSFNPQDRAEAAYVESF